MRSAIVARFRPGIVASCERGDRRQAHGTEEHVRLAAQLFAAAP